MMTKTFKEFIEEHQDLLDLEVNERVIKSYGDDSKPLYDVGIRVEIIYPLVDKNEQNDPISDKEIMKIYLEENWDNQIDFNRFKKAYLESLENGKMK